MGSIKHLHIICLDVPYPADYGGVYDLYYKLPCLADKGIRIHLHCFDKGRGNQPKLREFCEEVHYYPRVTGWKGIRAKFPYIISSRTSEALLRNLEADDFPVLLEGIHCTQPLLENGALSGRKILLRLHNVESIYYKQLARTTRSLPRKLFFLRESKLLRKVEGRLAVNTPIATVCQKDLAVYRERFHATNIFYLPVFLPFQAIRGQEGVGSFCLYHGNLSVPENEKAAFWLLENVFNRIKVPLVIAGKNPSRGLQKRAHLYQHTCLVGNPSEAEMNDLVRKAHINILPSFNATGIKLKLLHALFEGRHCVVNPAMVEGTGLEPLCHIAANADAFSSVVMQLYHQPFGEEELTLRKSVLQKVYNNHRNAELLIEHLY